MSKPRLNMTIPEDVFVRLRRIYAIYTHDYDGPGSPKSLAGFAAEVLEEGVSAVEELASEKKRRE